MAAAEKNQEPCLKQYGTGEHHPPTIRQTSLKLGASSDDTIWKERHSILVPPLIFLCQSFNIIQYRALGACISLTQSMELTRNALFRVHARAPSPSWCVCLWFWKEITIQAFWQDQEGWIKRTQHPALQESEIAHISWQIFSLISSPSLILWRDS